MVMMEEVLNRVLRTSCNSCGLLSLVVWERLARYRDVLCKTLVTSCAVDELPKESYSGASRGGKSRNS
jgi:hypothetical protein